MRTPVTLFNSCVVLLLGFFLAGCAAVEHRSKPGTTTTVIFTRHADRDADEDRLNARGQHRARALVEALKDTPVTAIYSPDLGRNRQTVEPLAKHFGIPITVKSSVAEFSTDDIAQEIIDKHAGGVVVWVGNTSGNLQAMYRHFGGTGRAPLEYGELYVITVPDQGPVRIRKLHYGP